MEGMPRPSVVVFVAEVRRMTAFYRDLASMKVLIEDDGYAVLEVEGLQVVIHALAGEPSVREAGMTVAIRKDSYVKLCLPVASIAASRRIAVAHGGSIKPESQEWEARGFRACDGHDPEGNVIQVREAAGIGAK